MNERSPRIDATYFREYGIHSVKNGEATDHIVSFPTWKDTESELSKHLPADGTIITPELITLDDDQFTDLEQAYGEVQRRIDFAKELTTRTNATMYLGTPQKTLDHGMLTEAPSVKWHNSSLQITNGEVTGRTHKTALLPIEHEAGFSIPRNKERTMRNGRAVLICAELHSLTKTDPFVQNLASELLAQTSWATPMFQQVDTRTPREKDAYYQRALEQAIGAITLRNFPNVRKVTMADRGTPDIAPYNGVFKRIDTK